MSLLPYFSSNSFRFRSITSRGFILLSISASISSLLAVADRLRTGPFDTTARIGAIRDEDACTDRIVANIVIVVGCRQLFLNTRRDVR